ncbi:hypothetical protein ATANTOWER_012038 [Ataeniobius toweri]|uniref:Uncharacterized protein n=1 Tax=Ataeniobius toweri TaxID=208326 RepID=A0ABU7AQ86_9TELE|nr:hypothetical protein [Ataeniobius toweri]
METDDLHHNRLQVESSQQVEEQGRELPERLVLTVSNPSSQSTDLSCYGNVLLAVLGPQPHYLFERSHRHPCAACLFPGECFPALCLCVTARSRYIVFSRTGTTCSFFMFLAVFTLAALHTLPRTIVQKVALNVF